MVQLRKIFGIDRSVAPLYGRPAMRIIRFLLLCFLLFESPSLVAAENAALSRNGLSQDGVLVLRNGRVLQGRISQIGDSYHVSFGPDSETRLPASVVEFACRDLHEAYAVKSQALNDTDVQRRLMLVEWCLQHELRAHAADQLLAVLKLEPENLHAQRLQGRLWLESQQPPSRPKPQTPTTVNVRTSPGEMERAIQLLPTNSVRVFASRIQPLVINRCGQGACHGSGGNTDFELYRPSSSRTINRRFTHRNLLATLQLVDRTVPKASKLLKYAGQRHGETRRQKFVSPTDEQMKQLMSWAESLGPERSVASPPTVAQRDRVLRQAPLPASGAQQPSTNETVPHRFGVLDSRSRQPHDYETFRHRPEKARDPFDPTIFNEKHHPTRTKDEKSGENSAFKAR